MEESLKSQALEKMLQEMTKDHTAVEDVIHNWLCDQEDEALFAGVLKVGRTIKGAVKHMANLARKQVTGNMAVVDDATAFGWVRDYFTGEDIEEVGDLNFTVQSAADKSEKHLSQESKRKSKSPGMMMAS